MGKDFSDLPTFAFPVMAWAPEPATEDPYNDGTVAFLTLSEVATTFFPGPLFVGWTFVDDKGRRWEVTSSGVSGRADGWWTRVLPASIYRARYRRTYTFLERPAIGFDQVKERLLLAVEANPAFYGDDGARFARERLNSVSRLADLFPSEGTFDAEASEPLVWWRQWLLLKGRCSRITFAVVFGVAAPVSLAALRLAERDDPSGLAFGAMAFAALLIAIAASVRRLHDLGVSGWWLLLGKPWLVMQLYFHNHPEAVGESPVLVRVVWTVSVLGVACLALWPGTRRPTAYVYGEQVGKASDD
jgi:uncharacterized membrane protein YhaH (DUF805 family)